MRTIICPRTGRVYRLGRVFAPPKHRYLQLRDYRTVPALPSAPATVSYDIAAASSCLSNIYGNDSYGDCVIAAMFHMIGVFFANAGAPLPANLTEADAVALYLQLTGGADTGLDIATTLDWWKTNAPISGVSPIAGYVSIDATDWDLVTDAVYLFENLDAGINLPDAWVGADMPNANGAVWDVAGDPDPNNGHSIAANAFGIASDLKITGVAGNTLGLLFNTWGFEVFVTQAAVTKYMAASAGGELYTILTPDIIARASALAPNKYNYAQLQADLASI